MTELTTVVLTIFSEMDPIVAISLLALGVVGYALHIIALVLRKKNDD